MFVRRAGERSLGYNPSHSRPVDHGVKVTKQEELERGPHRTRGKNKNKQQANKLSTGYVPGCIRVSSGESSVGSTRLRALGVAWVGYIF